MTVKEQPLTHPVKKALLTAFTAVDNIVSVDNKRRGPSLDFLSCLPALITQGVTTDAVTSGFASNGMADKETKTTPDFHNVIATCRRKVKQEESDLCLHSLPRLFNHQLEYGHI